MTETNLVQYTHINVSKHWNNSTEKSGYHRQPVRCFCKHHSCSFWAHSTAALCNLQLFTICQSVYQIKNEYLYNPIRRLQTCQNS